MGTNTMALIQTCQIQAIMTVPKRLSFSAQLSNCNLATCWHVELSMLSLLHLSISIHMSKGFSCSIKFFRLKITLGLTWANLGCCLRNHRKTLMSSVYFFLFPWEGFPRQTCSNHLRRKQGCKLIVQSWTVDFINNSLASALGGACAMGTNTMALIQTCQIQAIMTVQKRLFFSAQLSNCNLATCWHVELSMLSLLHLSISIHLSNSFSCSMKFFPGLALGESCVACATTEKH